MPQQHPRNLTWSAAQARGAAGGGAGAPPQNSLAQAFPSFQISSQDGRQGNVKVEARAPSGRTFDMGVSDASGVYTANFTPTEVGESISSC